MVRYPLELLAGVRWRGTPVSSRRAVTLLAVLAEGEASVDRLVDELWPDDPPADPAKAVQVVVSRTRKQTAADLVVRTRTGYRLGLPAAEVDALVVRELAARAAVALGEHDWPAARAAAAPALDLRVEPAEPDTALGRLRATAAEAIADCRAALAVALARLGEHAAAYGDLVDLAERRPDDEEVLAALLTAEARTTGPSAAMERYERYRRRLRDRLGADPGPELQRIQATLLASQSPTRVGVRSQQNLLIGRDDDLVSLREAIRSSRVTTILGVGGLGKTRMAHLLGAEAEQSAVYFVELVGVTDGAELLPAVRAAVGGRRLPGNRSLRAQAGSDPYGRLRDDLGAVPTLLILDNCEQVVDAVADLVARLVADLPGLTVLTTSRAPLQIAAERIYQLPQIATADGVRLFIERARAVRPGVIIDPATVAELVDRLDGLPLAIELAAARVRTMAVGDVLDRLSERFALLRGGNRDAPRRHQTLYAVIEWSWNLLGPAEQEALRRLSVFADGFDLAAAETVLGDDAALGRLEALAAQSLVTVIEPATPPGAVMPSAVRYRMLETVREFGRERLVAAGELEAAEGSVRDWAVGLCRSLLLEVNGPRAPEAVAVLRAEENNVMAQLARVDRGDDPVGWNVGAALLTLWLVLGDYSRVLGNIAPMAEFAATAPVKPQDEAAARVVVVAATVMSYLVFNRPPVALTERLRELGPGDDPVTAAQIRVGLVLSEAEVEELGVRLAELMADPDRHVVFYAATWTSIYRENLGDAEGALAANALAIASCRPEDGPYREADLRAQRAEFLAQLGRRAEAADQARLAIGPLRRLGVDVAVLEVTIALGQLDAGRLDEAERTLAAVSPASRSTGPDGGSFALAGRAEVAIARGDMIEAARLHRRALELMTDVRRPDWLPDEMREEVEPWLLVRHATALSAVALLPDGGTDGADLLVELAGILARVARQKPATVDFPVAGTGAFAVGLWGLLQRRWTGPRDRRVVEQAAELLVLAGEMGYSRRLPSMDWSVAVAAAERVVPGRLPQRPPAPSGDPADAADRLRRLAALIAATGLAARAQHPVTG